MSTKAVFNCSEDKRDTLRVGHDKFRNCLVLVQRMHTADSVIMTALHLSVDDVRKLRDVCNDTLAQQEDV